MCFDDFAQLKLDYAREIEEAIAKGKAEHEANMATALTSDGAARLLQNGLLCAAWWKERDAMARANLPWPTHDYTSLGAEFPHLTLAERLGCLAPDWLACADAAAASADGNVVPVSSGDSTNEILMVTNPTGYVSEGDDYVIPRDNGRGVIHFESPHRRVYDNRDICGTRLTTEALDELDATGSTVTMTVDLNNLKGSKYLMPSNLGIDVTLWKAGEGLELTGSREYRGHGLTIHGGAPNCLLAVWNQHVCDMNLSYLCVGAGDKIMRMNGMSVGNYVEDFVDLLNLDDEQIKLTVLQYRADEGPTSHERQGGSQKLRSRLR